LGHGRCEEFGVGEFRRPAGTSRRAEMIVDLDVQCGEKGVQIGRHKLILNTLRPSPDTAPTSGLLV
jgi:hypothetical protein